MSKNAVAKKDNTMSFEGADKLRNEVHEGLKVISKGYIAIMPQINKLYDCKGFKALGYQNYDDMCKIEFGMSHGTAVGIRKVWGLIGSVTANNEYIIPEKYKEWGYTQLLMIAQDKAKFEEAGIKPFEVFTPDMKIKEMAQALQDALGDKAQAQDASAIDTTGEEVTSEEPTSEEPTSEEPTSEEPTSTENVWDRITSEASIIRNMFGDTKDAKVIAQLDCLDVTIKELKKLSKKIK